MIASTAFRGCFVSTARSGGLKRVWICYIRPPRKCRVAYGKVIMRDDLDVLVDLESCCQSEGLTDWIDCRAEGATVPALLEHLGGWRPITYGMSAAEAARRSQNRRDPVPPVQPPAYWQDEIAKFLNERPRRLLEFWRRGIAAGMSAPDLLGGVS